VAVLPTPSVNAGSDINGCSGQTITLSATGASSYNWLPGNMTGSNVSVTPSASTTYTVVGSNSYGCTASDVIDVLLSQTAVIDAGTDITICQGSQTTLSATGGTSYAWNITGQTTASIRVSPSWTTTYTVTASNGNGCSGSDYVTVTVLPAPQVQLQPQFLCIGGSVTLNPNVTASSYLWTPGGQNTPSITVNQGGNYSVTITDANGCTASAGAGVTTGTTLSVNLTDITFCHHDTVVLDAGNPGSTYLWTPGAQTTQAISIYNSGTYGVTVTDPAGCTGAVTITATETPSPTAYWTATTSCEGSPTQFTNLSSVVGLNNNRYHWNFGDGGHSNLENPTYTYTLPGRYPVHLTIQSGNGCSAPYNGWVYVNPLPEVAFSANDVCQGQATIFNNLSSVSDGNIIGYRWDFGDGDTSNAVHPAHTYVSPGTMTVTLTVFTAGGCNSTLQQMVNVYPNPVAAATGGSACNGTTLTPGNGSSIASGSISSYTWNFGDGTSSTLANPSHVYSASGTYQLSLTATSSNGCSDTATAVIVVYPNPVANAGPDQTICPGTSVSISATGGASYYWLPANATTGTVNVSPGSSTTYTVLVTDSHGCVASDAVTVNVLNGPVAYANGTPAVCAGQSATLTGSGGTMLSWSPGGMSGGTVTVRPSATTDYVLTVTDLNGCTATDTVRIIVNRIPTLVVSPDQSVCAGSSVSLSAAGAFSYSWAPTGATGPVIAFTPQSNGTYTVTGTSLEGCTASATVRVTVNSSPQVALPPAFYCLGHTTVLDAGNPGSSYLWSNGQTTQQINVGTSGLYSVVVTAPNGCPGTASTTVSEAGNLQALPTADIVCAGETAVLNAGNPGSSYQWSTGATTQTISVTTAGTYLVTVTDAFGCSATMNHIVSINPLPVPSFTAAPGCAGSPITFINRSTVNGGSIGQSVWSFGNGSFSNSPSPTFTYPTDGTYQIGLTVTGNNGCSASTTGSVTIFPLPVADFSANASCLGTPTQFTDGSSVSAGTISNWQWDFGDNSTASATAFPSHTYLSAGNYDATLIVTSNNGCRDTIDRYLTVNGLPAASFSVINACTGSQVTFQNTSGSAWGSITGYSWDFGDGSVSNAVAPQHAYAAAGSYTVQLTATTINGCSASTTRTVTSFELPQASFTAAPACAGSPVSFVNTSSASGSPIAFSFWNLGNGITSNSTNPVWTYATDGLQQVSLVVISGNGCRDTVTGTVTVHPLPSPAFTSQDVCLNSATSFRDLSTVSNGNISGWNWDFGDNTVSVNNAPVHTYSADGTFPVQLTVTSDRGCTATVRSVVNVFPNPEVSFSASNVCFGSPVQFINQSTVAGGISSTENWMFSNGITSSDANPVISFAAAGSYQATLTVTSAQGCISTATNPVTVYNAPVAMFSTNGSCENEAISFLDRSSSQDGAIVSWTWNFGDGGATVQQDPTHNYSGAGTYTATLFAVSEFGCADTATMAIVIHERPDAGISVSPACAGTPVNISATGSNISTYLWDLGNGQTATTASFTQVFAQAGSHPVHLTAMNTFGCSDEADATVTIHPNPVTGFVTNPVCVGDRTIFSNSTTVPTGSIASYAWNFGDGQQSTAVNPNHIFQSPGNYQALLTATTDHGCTGTFSRTVAVHALPVVDFSTGVQGCSPVLFTPGDQSVSTDGIITGWLWDFGDGDISTDNRPSHYYTTSGNFSVSLTVVSSFGCQAQVTRPGFVTVFPGPEADFSMNGQATDLNPLVQFTNLSQGYTAFEWNFGDGQTDDTHSNPVHRYDELGSYTITLTTVNSFGCRDTVYKIIEVRPTSTLYAPNCFTPNGDGKNDTFKPEYTNMTDIEVWVFDRWGLLVSHFDGMNNHWDGYYGGRKCQSDTYVYKIKGKGIEGKDYEWIGHVSIVY
jgi:gliding motility-associated-like protein